MDSRWASRSARFLYFPVFRQIQLSVFLFCLYAAATMVFEVYYLQRNVHFPDGFQTVLGLSLSVLLVFRTNASYDRWWEGRRLWEDLLNCSRTLAAQTWNMTQLEETQRSLFLSELSVFPYQLRDHLRGEWPPPDNPPQRTAMKLNEYLNRWNREERLSFAEYLTLERLIAALYDVMGACERIRSTPLPLSHRAIIPQITVAYLLALPWGLDPGPVGVLMVGVASYFLISLEMIAEQLEDPFGREPDDLPLTRTSEVIEKSIARQLETVPPVERPHQEREGNGRTSTVGVSA